MNVDYMGAPNQGLKPDLIPPRGAHATGEVHKVVGGEDRIIYEQKVFDLHATLETRTPVMTPDGTPLQRKNPATGEPLITVHKVTPKYRTRRFILRPFPNGKVKAIENFELTPEQKRDREQRDARNRWMDEFRDLALQEGLTPAEVVRGFIGRQAGSGEELTLDEGDADELAQTLEEELGDEGVTARPELPFPIAEMSVRDIKHAVKEVELTAAQKLLLTEAEQGREEPRTTVLQLLV